VPTLSPAKAAHAVVYGIEKKKDFVLKPNMLRFVLWMNAAFPGNTAYIMSKTGWRKESNITFAKR
jgi:hypothetical protein